MTDKEEQELEEILLAYLRTSKKIKLAKLDVKKENKGKTYTVTFDVDSSFPGNLTASMDSPFSDIFKELNNDQVH